MKKTEPARIAEAWKAATWDGARKELLRSTLAATPAQRLAWLEEVLEIAYRAGALKARLSRPAG